MDAISNLGPRQNAKAAARGEHASTDGRPLRIAMIGTPWYRMPPPGYGGIELMAADLIEGLISRGHHVIAFGAGENGTRAEYHATYVDPPSHRVGDRWPELVHASVTEDLLRDLDVDIVHDHSAAGPMLARYRSVPTVVTTHGPLDGEPGTDNHDIGRYYRLLSGTVSFVAISDAQQRLAPELSWAGTVPNAIRVEDFPFAEQKDDFVLFLGRMKRYKGAHLAIDAARALGLRIVLAGKCCEEEELRYFADEISPRLGDDVDWLGEIDSAQKLDLLKRARCVLFPITWDEPFGLVMIEAMACGTPVVALRAGSVPEVIADGVSGIICDEPSQLPAAIEASAKLSPAACRQHVQDHFDMAAMTRGYEEVYRQVVAGAVSGPAAPAIKLPTAAAVRDAVEEGPPDTRTA